MKRILFHSTLRGAEWAGCEELWFQAARLLASRGHAVGANLPLQMDTTKNRARMAAAGIQWVASQTDSVRSILSRVGRRLNPMTPCKIGPCVRHASAWKADIVVVTQAACWGAYRDLLALRCAGIPYVSISQLNTPFVWPGERLFESVGDAFSGAAAAVFVSHGNLLLFQNQIARVLSNATVIYNPISFPIDRPCALPFRRDSMVLLNVARIDPAHKGQDLIVDVMAMPKWRARDVHVRIAGGGDTAWLRRLLAAKSLASVSLLGHVHDLRSEWERCTFGLFPSRYEGMPLAMIEGMALGRAIIATDVAGHREWIKHGSNGFLAAGAEAAALDAAIEAAWASRSMAASLGTTARAAYDQMMTVPPAEQLAALVTAQIS